MLPVALLCALLGAPDQVFSGPQKGEEAPPLKVLDLNGPKAGKEHDYLSESLVRLLVEEDALGKREAFAVHAALARIQAGPAAMPGLVAALAEAWSDPSPGQGVPVAVSQLRLQLGPEVIPALIDVMERGSPAEQHYGGYVMQHLGLAAARALAEGLIARDERLRRPAARALVGLAAGEIRKHRESRVLALGAAFALSEEGPERTRAAARVVYQALSLGGRPDQDDPAGDERILEHALRDADLEPLLDAVAEALAASLDGGGIEAPLAVDAVALLGPRAVPPLVAVLGSGDPTAQGWAELALGRLASSDDLAAEALGRALLAAKAPLRERIARILDHAGRGDLAAAGRSR
ncbi:MAG: hypothetical protein HY721_04260 [Planctomycetes bacterium]|nr:hypothetical protein [Planctomycetota bacterium]